MNSISNNNALPKGTKLQGGKFIVDNLLDKGGFSLIYEGRAIREVEDVFFGEKRTNIIDEAVIIKELCFKDKSERRLGQASITWRPQNKNDEELIRKFKEKTISEGEKLASLVHQTPHIIVIYAAFEENNTVYLITKKVKGAVDFGTIIKGNDRKQIPATRLSIKEKIRYLNQVCEALSIVHSNNIIHLDIKPENILRDFQDNAVLIDFGISVSLVGGNIETLLEGAITRNYSPPEQETKDKRNIGFYSDIYALGATMYFFFTRGVLPPDWKHLLSSGEEMTPPSHYNNEVSTYLDSVVMKCLSVNAQKRYQNIDELTKALNGESEYKKIVNTAQEALINREYEKGMQAIDKTQEYIPLNDKLKRLHNELQWLNQGNVKDSEVQQLLDDAQFYEDNNNLKQALKQYERVYKITADENTATKIEEIKTRIVDELEEKMIANEFEKYKNGKLSINALIKKVDAYLRKHPQDTKVKKQLENIREAEDIGKKNRKKSNKIRKELSKSIKNRWIAIILLFIVSIIIGIYHILREHSADTTKEIQEVHLNETDKEAWENAMYIDTQSAYQDYLDENEDGEYKQEAKRRIEEIETEKRKKEKQNQEDREDWEEALYEDTQSAYQDYLDENEDGAYKQEAKRKIEEIETEKRKKEKQLAKRKADRKAWENALRKNNQSAYQNYLNENENGAYKQEAKRKIEAIEKRTNLIATYEEQAMNYKYADEYIKAINQLEKAQSLMYSNSRDETIAKWKKEGDEKAVQLMKKAISIEIDNNLEPCDATLKKYYRKVRKMTTNKRIIDAIKCNN